MEFVLGDIFKILHREFADKLTADVGGAFFELKFLFDEFGDGGGFEDERKRSIVEDSDFGGDHLAAFILGLFVELVAELHDVDAVLTQSRSDWGSGVGGATGSDDFDNGLDFFGHDVGNQ